MKTWHREYCDWVLIGLHSVFLTSAIPGTPMPYIPSVGNELNTTWTFAQPPIATLGGGSQYGYSRGLDCPS